MAETALSERLEQLETDYSSSNIDWVKYVHDHYRTIFETCTVHTLDVNRHFWEYYRMEDFLKSQGYDPNLAWLVFYLNQIPTNIEMHDIKTLLLPNMDILKSIYQNFLQNKSHIKSSRS